MKRRRFFGHVTSGLVAGVIGTRSDAMAAPPAASPMPSPAPDASPVRTPLALMAPRADGIDAIWGVTRLCTGRLEWEGPDRQRGTAAVDPFGFVPQGEHVLRVRLSGLRPGTRYRVRSVTRASGETDQVASPWKTFRTLDPGAAETSFVVWNDTHIHDDTIRKLHEVTPPADFLLWNGDTCNDWKSPDILVPTLLHPGQCDVTEGRPLLLTFGNHDVRGPYAFEMPDVVATPSERPFYAFRSGPVAVICLHTGEDKPDSHPSFAGRVAFDALRREQAEWLAGIIREPGFRDAPYRVVFCHIPLRWLDESPQDYDATGFDRHSGRSREAWHDALVTWKAQVIVSGHTHRQAWLPATSAFPYGQLVGGGPRMPDATWIGGKADARAMTLETHALDGTVLQSVSFAPLA
jgi:hypothetical protein